MWVLLLVAIGVAAAYGLSRAVPPRWILVGVAALLLLLEDVGEPFAPALSEALYDGGLGPRGLFRITDISMVFLVVSVANAKLSRSSGYRELRVPIVLLCAGALVGIVGGLTSDAQLSAATGGARPLVYLAVGYWATTRTIVEWNELRRPAVVLAGIIVLKSATGVVAAISNRGYDQYGEYLSFYSPLANWAGVVLLLWLFGMGLSGAYRARWVLLAALPIILSLALSLRRSFWIAALLGIVVVLVGMTLIHPGARRRLTWLAAIGGVAAASLGATVAPGVVGNVGAASISARGQTFSSLSSTAADRYRGEEFAAVTASLRAQPVTGLGFGVPWTSPADKPLSAAFEGGRQYTHNSVTTLWLRLGVLGPVAYFAAALGLAMSAVSLWRTRIPFWMMTGLVVGGALLGTGFADFTAAFVAGNGRVAFWVGMSVAIVGMARSASMTVTSPVRPERVSTRSM